MLLLLSLISFLCTICVLTEAVDLVDKLKKLININIIILLLITLFLIVGYSFVASLIFRISILNTISYIYLQFFLTFIPGIALYILFQKKEKSWLIIVVLSYALGYALNILEYFLLMPFNLGNLLKYLSIFISIFSIFILVKKPLICRPFKLKDIIKDEIIYIFVIVLVWETYSYAITNTSPLLSGITTYSRDLQYWINNSVGLYLQFPADNAFLSGMPLYYHYFSSLHIAFSSLVTGINIFTLSLPLYPLTKSILMYGGIYYLLDVFNATNKQKIFLIIVLLLSSGFENISIVTNISHFHLLPFGMDIAIAYGSLFLGIFIEAYKNSSKKFDWSLYFIAITFYAILAGIKSPTVTVLSVFPAVICIIWLFQKKFKYCFIYGFSILTVFIIIGIFCSGMLYVFGETDSLYSVTTYSMADIAIYSPTSSTFTNALISTGVMTIYSHPLIVILFGISCIKLIFDIIKKRIDKKILFIKIGLIITVLISIAAWQIINAGGHSEMYFIMSSYIAMVALCVEPLSLIKTEKNIINKILIYTFIFCYFIAQIILGATNQWNKHAIDKARVNGIKILRDSGEMPLKDTYEINGIAKTDVEGLSWIRDNTPLNSIIIADRAMFDADEYGYTHYFYYTIFAERQMYVEGTSFINPTGTYGNIVKERHQLVNDLFNNVQGAYEGIVSEGVDYIVQTKWITPQFEPNKNMTLVCSTYTINIYRVK